MKPTIYVSGPMRGMPDDNFPMFKAVAAALRGMGTWDVVDPSEHFGGQRGLPRHKYLAADVIDLVTNCHAICLMPGFSASEGACLEAQIAMDMRYDLYFWGKSGLAPIEAVDVQRMMGDK